MKNRLISILAFMAPGLLAVGTYLPMVRTTRGYTYSIVDTPVLLIYGAALLIFALNVVSLKQRSDIVKQLHFVGIAMVAGCVIYGAHMSLEGIDWFSTQTAFNAPAIEGANLDAYWQKLSEYAGRAYQTFWGDLREIYQAYGPYATVNDVQVFEEVINSLSSEQKKSLYQVAGISYSVLPLGVACYVAALGLQVVLMVMLRRADK